MDTHTLDVAERQFNNLWDGKQTFVCCTADTFAAGDRVILRLFDVLANTRVERFTIEAVIVSTVVTADVPRLPKDIVILQLAAIRCIEQKSSTRPSAIQHHGNLA